MVYDFYHPSDNLNIRLNAHYKVENVKIAGSNLILTQRGYSEGDRLNNKAVSVASLQSKVESIRYGTFRAVMKLGQSNGGSCASLFWYHNDQSEIDIEAVTQGTSLVNNTINYTNHPSLDQAGNPIPNATLSIPISADANTLVSTFREHRFDSDANGVKFYLDQKLIKTDSSHIVKDGGNLQLKLWADGNKWWSGIPSTTDVDLTVKSIIAYYNTTEAGYYSWQKQCERAGGTSKHPVCEAELDTSRSSGSAKPSHAANAARRLSAFGF